MSATSRARRRQPTDAQVARAIAAAVSAYGINGHGTGRPVNSSGSFTTVPGKRKFPPRVSGPVGDLTCTLPITLDDGSVIMVGTVIPADAQVTTRKRSTQSSRARQAATPTAPVYGRESVAYATPGDGLGISAQTVAK